VVSALGGTWMAHLILILCQDLMVVHLEIAGKTVAIGKIVDFPKLAGTQH
jgi:hypothetical protein